VALREKRAKKTLRGKVSQGANKEKLAKEQFRQQSNELEIRDGQLRAGADREKLAEEQIQIRTKAMETHL